MKTKKRILNSGLAFSESKILSKLNGYAKRGWLLEGFSGGGLFFDLKKDKPEDIEYSLDYQSDVDEEYFSMFEAAGWTHAVTMGYMHIFKAPTGTKAIYSDKETTIDKFEYVKRITGISGLFAFVPTFILLLSLFLLEDGLLWTVIFVLFIVCLVITVFSWLPYLAYTFRVRKLTK